MSVVELPATAELPRGVVLVLVAALVRPALVDLAAWVPTASPWVPVRAWLASQPALHGNAMWTAPRTSQGSQDASFAQ